MLMRWLMITAAVEQQLGLHTMHERRPWAGRRVLPCAPVSHDGKLASTDTVIVHYSLPVGECLPTGSVSVRGCRCSHLALLHDYFPIWKGKRVSVIPWEGNAY